MMNSLRLIEPEWLDVLPPADPRAKRSRQDLRRLNLLMGNIGILQRNLNKYWSMGYPLVIAELGAGDGTFMLALARRLSPKWGPVKVILIDRQSNITEQTRRAMENLDWSVECVTADVFDWMASSDALIDIIICNLFLHHFHAEALSVLFASCAQKTTLFLACEPARSPLSLCSSYLLGLIGCNDVTRHDAVVSVRAGFRRNELTNIWPDPHRWVLEERSAGLFSHVFVSRRAGIIS